MTVSPFSRYPYGVWFGLRYMNWDFRFSSSITCHTIKAVILSVPWWFLPEFPWKASQRWWDIQISELLKDTQKLQMTRFRRIWINWWRKESIWSILIIISAWKEKNSLADMEILKFKQDVLLIFGWMNRSWRHSYIVVSTFWAAVRVIYKKGCWNWNLGSRKTYQTKRRVYENLYSMEMIFALAFQLDT